MDETRGEKVVRQERADPIDPERAFHISSVARFDADPGKPPGHLCFSDEPCVHPEAELGTLVEAVEQGGRLFDAEPLKPPLDEPEGKAVFDGEARQRVGRKLEVVSFPERPSQHGVDEAGSRLALGPLHVLHHLVYHVIGRLVHEKELIEGHPEKIAHILLELLSHEMGEHPVEIELPSHHARDDLVDERFVENQGCRRGEMAVYGLVEGPALFDFFYDRDAG